MSIYTKTNSCRICKSHDLVEILNLGVQALTGVFPAKGEQVPEGPLAIVKCGKCHLVQLAHSYDLSKLYGQNYGYRSGLNQSMVRHLSGKVQKLLKFVELNEGDLIIDVGSNDSTLLQNYGNRGLKLVGVDPSGSKFLKYYPSWVRLVPDFFPSKALHGVTSGQKAKIITSIAMFYDLEDPIDFVRNVYKELDENGVWCFEQAYLGHMLDFLTYDTVCHEHLEYYAFSQVHMMLSEVGFKVIDLEFNDVNGGSFSVVAAKRSSKHKEVTELVNKTLSEEKEKGYHQLGVFQDFKERVESHRNELRKLVQDLRAQGKTIYGYGASTKGNVLLQYCGLTNNEIGGIAEVNEDKFGKYTPGTLIPILSEAEAKQKKPDYLLVLPWHFKKSIVEREAEWLKGGGKMIFPLPQIEVVQKS